MKTSAKKIAVAAVAAVGVLGAGSMLAACGGESAAKTTGFYTSQNTLTYMNFAPMYNYRTLTYKTQNIETFDDNTYVLSVNATTYSNVYFGESVPSDQYTANPQGSTVVRYYGKFTREDDGEDFTLKLEVPTRVYDVSFGRLPIDTANWTTAMTEYMESWTFQGNPMGKDEDGNTYTADTWLAHELENFTETIEVYVTGSTCTFGAIEKL